MEEGVNALLCDWRGGIASIGTAYTARHAAREPPFIHLGGWALLLRTTTLLSIDTPFLR